MVREAIYLLLCALMLCWLSPSLAYGADPTLVGWWKLDEGVGTAAHDLSDYGNHGTLQGAPLWTVGMLDGVLEFDGSADYVAIPHRLSLSITKAITVAAWTYMAPSAGTMPENDAAVTIGRRSLGGTYFEGIIDNGAARTPIMKSNGKSRMKEDYYV